LSVDTSPSGQIKRGRFATIALSLVLGWYVFTWSRQVYGAKAGILSLCLFAFDPNILAHGHLVTTDLYAALMTTAALYHFGQFSVHGGLRRALLSAAVIGLAQHAKLSCIYFYPILAALALIRWIAKWRATRDAGAEFSIKGDFRRGLLWCALFGSVSVMIINIGFGFQGTGMPLARYNFSDSFFRRLQQFPGVSQMPVPFPSAYVQGLDMVKHHDNVGKFVGNLYLEGKLKLNPHDESFSGFTGYFLRAALYKVPIATQILVIFALLSAFPRSQRAGLTFDDLTLLLPIVVYWVQLDFFFKTQVGIRYLLPLFPLAFIFCGRLLKDNPSPRRSYACGALVAGLIVSTLSYYPHFLPYFNEYIGDRKWAYLHLADSNLDWGGNQWYLKEHAKRHPEAVFHPEKPQPGHLVVAANDLVGVAGDPERYRWLRENFEPTDHVAYSHLVFEISPEDFERKVAKQQVRGR
jgi:hypothetical protein